MLKAAVLIFGVAIAAAFVAPIPSLEASGQSRLMGNVMSDGKKDDLTTLDGIITAYYEVVSGPAGEAPDYERDASLHRPDALVSVALVDSQGKPQLSTMTLKGFHERFGGPRRQGFYEWEIHRRTERFGNIANVWSTYVTSDKPNGEARARGINNIQLFFDGQRWWITSWIFDSERTDNPIPKVYLP